MASTTNGIATILEACTIGGATPPADLYRCVLLSELGTFGCALVDKPTVEYVANQTVKYQDIKRAVAPTYSIIYHSTDPGFNDIIDGPYADGSWQTVRTNPFNNPPHVFQYWTQSGSMAPIYASTSIQINGEDIHLYANWQHYYYVTFNTNGKGTAPSQQLIAEGGTVTKPTDPSASGYNFGGWYEDNNVWDKPWNFEKGFVTQNTTLYALWGSGYVLTVMANPSTAYGTTTGSGVYSANTQVPISAAPNIGYKFAYWVDDRSTNPNRTVTVTRDVQYDALFMEIPTGDLRIVGADLKLYSYGLYQAMTTKPTTIGVAINIGDDWLIYHKTTLGQLSLGSGNNPPDNIPMQTPAELLYPHSGKPSADKYIEKWPDQSNYACNACAAVTTSGLTWYLPGLWELNTIFERAANNSGGTSYPGFQSHLSLIGGNIIQTDQPSGHAHWSCEAGEGKYPASATGKLPWRVYLTQTGDNTYTIWNACTGNYTYVYDPNYVRPVARLATQGKHTLKFVKGEATSGTVPSSITLNHNDQFIVPGNSGNLSKPGKVFLCWKDTSTNEEVFPNDIIGLTQDRTFAPKFGEIE